MCGQLGMFQEIVGPLGLQEFETPIISRKLANKGGKVVSPKHRPPLFPTKCPWFSFLSEAESTPGP